MALFLFYVYVKCFFIIATSSINYQLIKVYRFTSPGTKIFKLIGNALLGDALVLKFQFNNRSAVTTSVWIKIKYCLTKCGIMSIKACPIFALGFTQGLQLPTPKT